MIAWTGPVPQERSYGCRERKGPITTTGNAHVRRILVEAAWHHRHRAGATLVLNLAEQ